MARRDTATDATKQQLTDGRLTPGDGHSKIVEEAASIDPNAEIYAPMGSSVLYEGIDGESIDDIEGESAGSTLLDDLAGSDLPDPTDGFDDQNSWAMDLPSGLPGYPTAPPPATPTDSELLEGLDAPGPSGMLDSLEGIVGGNPAPEAGDTAPTEEAPEPEEGSDSGADDGGDDRGSQGESSGEEDEPKSQDEPSDDDDDDEGESQGGSSDAPRESQTTPAPDDGTGGDPDASDFIGGSGDVDPARETEGHGGGGGLDMERAGSGAVDPAPETEDSGAGGLDMERLGIGVIDPLGGESSLLGDDTGDLAEMAAEADLIEVEVEFDDVLVDADIGEDV